MKIKAEIMQVLVAELQPNLIGAFYVMSLGFEIPDTVTKTDLTNIIWFLCKQLDWIEVNGDFLSEPNPLGDEVVNYASREVSGLVTNSILFC